MSAAHRLLALVMGIAVGACAAPVPWPDRADIIVTLDLDSPSALARDAAAAAPTAGHPGTSGLIVCVADAEGAAQCHHRDGVLAGRAAGAGVACPGAARPLASRCPDAAGCAFPGVPAPAGTLGLLVLARRPPVFGVPRHAVLEQVVLSGSPGPDPPATARLGAVLRGLAACLTADAGPGTAHEVQIVPRQACEERECALARSRLRLAPFPAGRTARLPSTSPSSQR